MKIHKVILSTILFFITTTGFAADLMDVYEKAFANDPKFKAARSNWLADKETIAIKRADLLPQITAKGDIARNRYEVEKPLGSGKLYHNTSGYTLQLTQSIFNFGSWANVWGAQAIAKKSKATFMASEEELLRRTAEAYFNVLKAKDTLSYAKAHKASVERLFIQAKHKFDVGLTPITDLEDARRDYDRTISDEIGATNDLDNKFEQLNEITGVRYYHLDSVEKDFPLLSPNPNDIEQWVKAAEQQNFELIAARFDAIAARENIKVANAGHLPTLTAQGNYNYGYDNNIDGNRSSQRTKTASATMELSVPVFQGGKIVASARQADYIYQAKLSTQEQIHRTVISQTRQIYLGILSNISKIKADQQAIKSAQSSLRANQASYSVGSRTMADVLKAQTEVFNAQKTFAEDEYAYIIQLLKLKELTGILDTDDLKQVNSWLVKPVEEAKTATSVKQPIRKNQAQTSVKSVKATVIKSKNPASKNKDWWISASADATTTKSQSAPKSELIVIDTQKIEPTLPSSNK